MRFGLLPRFKTRICLDLELLDNRTIFTNRTPGTLKLVVHRQRTAREEVARFELGTDETYHDIKVRFENFFLSDVMPDEFPVPQKKIVDEFGQWKEAEWPGKIRSLEELAERCRAREGEGRYPFPEWDKWGGDRNRKLKEGTGFFSAHKTADGRWHLADPEGYDYFSAGPCGTHAGEWGRIDSFEECCDWLPEKDPEYQEKSERYARKLREWKDDPWLIGYFLRNEPEFNFVENLAIAEEVLRNPAQTFCRKGLIAFLKDKYKEIEALNQAWKTEFDSFAVFGEPLENCMARYPGSESDIREFSGKLITEYIRVLAMACRAEDPNHLNLGLRWSKANNADMMKGWEYFDVFSINCYDFDPTKDMDFVKNAGVDLPILIGEYYCGALDRGLTATGLKGVKNQEERGVMWRYFLERVAAHPYGVAAHWFQYNDQFCLGRYDGENYQIGMVDVCMQPYPELMKAVRASAEVLYQVKNGEKAPYSKKPKEIPMIGY